MLIKDYETAESIRQNIQGIVRYLPGEILLYLRDWLEAEIEERKSENSLK